MFLLFACVEVPDPGSVSAAFDDASAQTGVPAELLLAIAKVETGLHPIRGGEEFPGQIPAYGIMALRGERVEEGADLAGIDATDVREDTSANVWAAAALLAAWADEWEVETDDLGAWAPVVAEYSGIDDFDASAEYVWYEVYETLAEGVDAQGFRSEPREATPRYPRPSRTRERTGDAGAVWTSSPNTSSRSGAAVEFVIVHTCEGSYSGCWGWLTNSSSGVSAHYVVNDDGSEVRQLVDETSKAWHISASYDCDNNAGVECWRDGTAMNAVSVGIEHAGYGSQTSWNSGLIQTSAELACGVTQRHGVVRDAYHIVGHGQLQPYNRTDPGAAWPWSDYLAKVDAACGGSSSSSGSGSSSSGSGASSSSSPTATQFVIDSSNAANDTSWYYVEVSDSWWSSTSTSGYWNSGYWAAPTASVSDAAEFWFKAEAETCYAVEAWWTAGSNRPPAVVYLGWDEDEREVGRATVNQQSGGSGFNHLGEWTFPAGWNRVLLSRWTTSGYYAIADAVRLTPCS